MTCGTCFYCYEKPGLPEGAGECHGNPPAIVQTEKGPGSFYPMVMLNSLRCRHYQPRVKMTADKPRVSVGESNLNAPPSGIQVESTGYAVAPALKGNRP
jgi:hypothetical protein